MNPKLILLTFIIIGLCPICVLSINNNPVEQEECAQLMSECGKSIDDGREKIIKKLCDNVYIKKTV